MARAEVRALAAAIRKHSHRQAMASRRAYYGIVTSVDPLAVDIAGVDDSLDAEVAFDETVSLALDAEPLAVGDTLALLEMADDDYIAVGITRG